MPRRSSRSAASRWVETIKPKEFRGMPSSILNDERFRGALWRFPAVVVNVVDGDTADYLLDQGLHNYPYRRIRHTNYDAPETLRGSIDERRRGREAKTFLHSDLFRYDEAKETYQNRWVGLLTDKPEWVASLDRWVGEVLVVWQGEVWLLSELMIAKGHTKQPSDTDWSK